MTAPLVVVLLAVLAHATARAVVLRDAPRGVLARWHAGMAVAMLGMAVTTPAPIVSAAAALVFGAGVVRAVTGMLAAPAVAETGPALRWAYARLAVGCGAMVAMSWPTTPETVPSPPTAAMGHDHGGVPAAGVLDAGAPVLAVLPGGPHDHAAVPVWVLVLLVTANLVVAGWAVRRVTARTRPPAGPRAVAASELAMAVVSAGMLVQPLVAVVSS